MDKSWMLLYHNRFSQPYIDGVNSYVFWRGRIHFLKRQNSYVSMSRHGSSYDTVNSSKLEDLSSEGSSRFLCLGRMANNTLERALLCGLNRVGVYSRWQKLIQRPYENGDERGLRLVKAILRPLMLRRMKDSTDKEGRPILVLPPADIQLVECDQSEAERDFYDALFMKSKVKFDQFVAQGRVLHNYASILELLLRLRQCCNHPFLVMRADDLDLQLAINSSKLIHRQLKSLYTLPPPSQGKPV